MGAWQGLLTPLRGPRDPQRLLPPQPVWAVGAASEAGAGQPAVVPAPEQSPEARLALDLTASSTPAARATSLRAGPASVAKSLTLVTTSQPRGAEPAAPVGPQAETPEPTALPRLAAPSQAGGKAGPEPNVPDKEGQGHPTGLPHFAAPPAIQPAGSELRGAEQVAEPAALGERVAERLLASPRPGTSRLQVQLDPPSLGRVDVDLTLDADESVRASLRTDLPTAAGALHAALPEIRSALESHGFRVASLGVSGSGSDVAGQTAGHGAQQQEQQAAAALPAPARPSRPPASAARPDTRLRLVDVAA
jgi:flagellar hook-length control protein FliK